MTVPKGRRALLPALLIASGLLAQGKMDWSAPLPPVMPWSGPSEALIVANSDPWVTPSERTGLTATPTYDETVAWLRRLVDRSPQLQMISLGSSAEGRDIWMVIASESGASTPAELKRDRKPILLAQAGIHAGEIDGKDAGLMLLRDLTVRGVNSDLLLGANFLFIPILSVDGHERRSPTNRINQRGPTNQGWRTNSRNLNLNRDYAKLDTEEIRAIVKAINAWEPDLYLDLHVTDGIDYQYDITFGHPGAHTGSPFISKWLDERLTPALHLDLKRMGHIPGPLVFAVDNLNPGKGIISWTGTPRYSDGYGAVRHLPTVLVENLSLKPYRQRVLGTYVLLESTLQTLGRHGQSLQRAVAADQTREPSNVTLSWKAASKTPDMIPFKGIKWRLEPSAITGGKKIIFTGEPEDVMLPVIAHTAADITVRRPKAYWIPPAWNEIIERLAIHGIFMEAISAERTVRVELDRFSDVKIDPSPFEGHMRVSATAMPERRRVTYPPGTVRVPTSQPLGDLAISLLEPRGPDSFFQWGFFLEILQQSEYAEGYVMEPLAERMLANDKALKREFEAALKTDPELAANPQAQVQWLYAKSPYFDERLRLYPIGREW